MLKITLENLKLRCIVGVHAKERLKKQPLHINAEVLYSAVAAARICESDTIEQGIDYVGISDVIRTTAETGRFQTLEALCASAAADVLTAFPAAVEIRLQVRKPRALPGSTVAGVEYLAVRTGQVQR